MESSALTRLVGDADTFLASTFGRAPLHVRAEHEGAFDDVLSLAHVDELIAATGLRAPSFRVVKDGVTLPTSRVTRRVRIGSHPVDDLIDVAAVQAAFRDGASIVLQGLHRSWTPVTRLCRALESELTHPVQANAYLTPPVSQGLHLHEDPHDVFAVQTHGVKRWVVHPPDGGEAWDLELRAGDVLYLPAGTRHAAQTIELPSLHLTIGVRTVAWDTVVRRAVEDVLASAVDTTPLPAGWADDPDAHGAQVAGRLQYALERLAADTHGVALAAMRGAADDFWAKRVPERRGGILDVLRLDELGDRTPLAVRAENSRRLQPGPDGQVTLVLADRRLRFPSAMGDVLAEVLRIGKFRPGDLGQLIDEPSRLVLCRRLVREGVLTIEGDRRGGPG